MRPSTDRIEALCRASDILILRGSGASARDCPHALVLTAAAFDRGGAAEIYRDADRWRVVWANEARGARPWTGAER